MCPTKNEHLELVQELISVLQNDIQLWIKSGNLFVGDKFVRPLKTENGFTTQGGVVDTIINWDASLDQIYGRALEKFALREKLLKHLSIFYGSKQSCPPRVSGGDNITPELRCLLLDILESSSTTRASYSFPNPLDIAEKSYNFFIRPTDIFYMDIPLLGLDIKQSVTFKWGELIPIDFETRIDCLRDRSVGRSNMFHNQTHYWRVLDAKVLLRISLEVPRSDLSDGFCGPNQLHAVARNTVELLRMYGYGGVLDCFQSIYVVGVGRRGCGVITSGVDIGNRETYQVDDPTLLAKFLDSHVCDKFDQNHELNFIVNRVTEAWNRTRSQEFQIFDYVSILEALLIPNSESETSFKVSLYAAHLTGESKEARNETFELLRRAYKIRNAIAHCKSEIKPKDKLTPSEQKKFGEIVHLIIRKAFSDGGVDALRAEARSLIL